MRIALFLFFLAMALSSCKKEDTSFFPDVPHTPISDFPIDLIGFPGNMSLRTNTQQMFVPSRALNSKGYSYGSTLRLNDSSLLVSCVKFEDFGDDNHSYIVGKRSNDNGHTWSNEFTMQENIGVINTGPPSLLKISEKHIMFFFGVKNSRRDIVIYCKESFDDGKFWGPLTTVTKSKGYFILNNDRAIYTGGRIILPMAFANEISRDFDRQVIFCYYSDDLGKTWKQSNVLKANIALMEPSVAPLGNKEILMSIRTTKGFVYFSRSSDNGVTWKGIYKSNIKSPESPQALIRVNKSDTLLMVWNFNTTNGTDNHEDRDPLTIAFSTDKGDNWQKPVNLQSDTHFNYFYPSISVYKGIVHITYAVRRKQTYEPSLFYNELTLKELFK